RPRSWSWSSSAPRSERPRRSRPTPDGPSATAGGSRASTRAVAHSPKTWHVTGRDRDGVRGRRQQHRLDVRVSVRALVGLVEVLRPATHVVVGVVDALRNELLHARAEVLQGAVLPLVDEERRRRVLAERDRGAVGHPRVLDRALELLGEIQVGVALHSRDLDRRGPGLHEALLVSAAAATGRSNVNTLPFPTSLSARIRPPWASTTDLAIA